MYDSFASQLAGLDLSGFSITPAPFNEADFPCEDAMAHTLGAVWSDLFALWLSRIRFEHGQRGIRHIFLLCFYSFLRPMIRDDLF